MKKILGGFLVLLLAVMLTGCTTTTSSDEDGQSKREFNVSETAIVNNTRITINSVTKLEQDCFFEFNGECSHWSTPDNDFFIVIDLTIENTGSNDLAISSIMTFDLKDNDGVQGKYAFLMDAIKSQLDGSVMPGDKLTGQIAYDVSESDVYNFYFRDSLLDSPIKFIIQKSDIK